MNNSYLRGVGVGCLGSDVDLHRPKNFVFVERCHDGHLLLQLRGSRWRFKSSFFSLQRVFGLSGHIFENVLELLSFSKMSRVSKRKLIFPSPAKIISEVVFRNNLLIEMLQVRRVRPNCGLIIFAT